MSYQNINIFEMDSNSFVCILEAKHHLVADMWQLAKGFRSSHHILTMLLQRADSF